jgi:hypothetical protein
MDGDVRPTKLSYQSRRNEPRARNRKPSPVPQGELVVREYPETNWGEIEKKIKEFEDEHKTHLP